MAARAADSADRIGAERTGGAGGSHFCGGQKQCSECCQRCRGCDQGDLRERADQGQRGDPDSGLFACSKLAGIVVLGGPGDNAIDLSALAIGDLLPGTPISADGQGGNDTLTGGPYDQTLKGGDGDDVLRVKEIGGATLLDGGEDGDTYQVDFGMSAAALNINDGGKVGFDTLTANGTPGDDSLEMDDTHLSRGTEVINFTLGSLEKATILAGNGNDLFLLLCDRFTTDLYGGPGSDTMTVREIEAVTLLDGGEDGDGYEVDFGMLPSALTIDDTGNSAVDALTANGTPGDDRPADGRHLPGTRHGDDQLHPDIAGEGDDPGGKRHGSVPAAVRPLHDGVLRRAWQRHDDGEGDRGRHAAGRRRGTATATRWTSGCCLRR